MGYVSFLEGTHCWKFHVVSLVVSLPSRIFGVQRIVPSEKAAWSKEQMLCQWYSFSTVWHSCPGYIFNTLRKTNIAPENGWLMMVGRLLSFWQGLFLGAMLVLGRVFPSYRIVEGWGTFVYQHRICVWYQSRIHIVYTFTCKTCTTKR